jgi:2-haloacid dehalogenase
VTAVVDLVVFDVNETLLALDPVADELATVGLAGSFELWFARILRDGIAAAAAGRTVSFAALARHHVDWLRAERGLPPDDEVTDRVLAAFEELRPHPDVAAGLAVLAEHGVPAVALTNGSAALTRRLLARAELGDAFLAVHEVAAGGRWKPAPEPYQHVVAHHAVAPDRAALIAVHPWDVIGAQAAGLLGAWLRRTPVPYPDPFGDPDVVADDLPGLARRLVGIEDGT